jgi:hypothetical protein
VSEVTAVNTAGTIASGDKALPAIDTRAMDWMPLGDFLQRHGVLEVARWHLRGAYVSADGKTLTGTAVPLAADYYHGFRLELDQVYVCSGSGAGAKTLRVGFPDAMDQHLARGDAVGICLGAKAALTSCGMRARADPRSGVPEHGVT